MTEATLDHHDAINDAHRAVLAIGKAEVKSRGSSNHGNTIELHFGPDQQDDYLALHHVGQGLGKLLAGLRAGTVRECLRAIRHQADTVEDGEMLYRLTQDVSDLATSPDGRPAPPLRFGVTGIGEVETYPAMGSGSITFDTSEGELVLDLDGDLGNALAERAIFVQHVSGDASPAFVGKRWLRLGWALVPAFALGLLLGSLFL